MILSQILKTRKTDEKGMVRYGESSFKSLVLIPAATFGNARSLLNRRIMTSSPASAWDIDFEDVRLKMCADQRRRFHHRAPRVGPQLLPDGVCGQLSFP